MAPLPCRAAVRNAGHAGAGYTGVVQLLSDSLHYPEPISAKGTLIDAGAGIRLGCNPITNFPMGLSQSYLHGIENYSQT